jgi:hypothetical protein
MRYAPTALVILLCALLAWLLAAVAASSVYALLVTLAGAVGS